MKALGYLFLAVLVVITFSIPGRAQIHFTANLTSGQTVPADTSMKGSGTGAFTLSDDMRELAYSVTYHGLSGPLSGGGHFHTGGYGVAGPIVKPIASTGDSTSATITGVWRASDASNPLTPALVESLLVGEIYVNFHTATHPAGEIRGQLNLASGLHFSAQLTGTQETPANSSTGTGTGAFWLDAAKTGLNYRITFHGLSDTLTGGHFHVGDTGVAGPIVRPILGAGDSTAGTVQGVWLHADTVNGLNDSLIGALIAGRIYVNLHTAAHPGGEIRGQLKLEGGIGFSAALDGASEFPPDSTSRGSGTASLALTNSRTAVKYAVSYTGLSGLLSSGAQIFSGTSIVKTLFVAGDATSGTISGTWNVGDASEPFTRALRDSLLAGKLYINFFTSLHPGGEIRGQIHPTTGIGTIVTMDGKQETPHNTSSGTGTASIVISPERTIVLYNATYTKLSGPLTGGHFHTGAPGVAGPIVKPIASAADSSIATFNGTWRLNDTANALTYALVDSLIAGKAYLNFHSTVYPGGEIRGQIQFDTALFATSVIQAQTPTPTAFQLTQNYPNPFNPTTSIDVRVSATELVQVKVYDLLGREIATLLSERLNPGLYQIRWDANGFASGVYYYRLTAGTFTATKKMMLMK